MLTVYSVTSVKFGDPKKGRALKHEYLLCEQICFTLPSNLNKYFLLHAVVHLSFCFFIHIIVDTDEGERIVLGMETNRIKIEPFLLHKHSNGKGMVLGWKIK